MKHKKIEEKEMKMLKSQIDTDFFHYLTIL